MLRRLNMEKLPSEWYLISEGFSPGKKPVCPRNFDKVWNKIRAATGLPDNMQLYSLRDTGITDLKMDGYSNLYISGITGHLNSAEIETYTHNPDVNALRHVLEKSRRL
jgi:hypothetical protein